MAKNRYRVYVEKDTETGLYAVRCLEISVFSQGKDEKEALDNIKEAIRLHIEALSEEASKKKLIEVEV
jgi:predicted RNase H-like HicB family nuclease